MRHVFTGTDNFLPLSEERAARRARIAAQFERARACEASLPSDEQRQCIDLTAEAAAIAQALAPQQAPPRRLRPALVLAAGLPIAIAAAYLLALLLGRVADVVGAAIAN